MTQRRAQVILLCEDGQHEAFLRRFLNAIGIHPRAITVVKCPSGRGCGEQWVREHYAAEVRKLRASQVARALVVVLDEDNQGIGRREEQLARALRDADLEPRGDAERIVHVIPARNIETWLTYLRGGTVDERARYPKLDRPRECRAHGRHPEADVRRRRAAFTRARVPREGVCGVPHAGLVTGGHRAAAAGAGRRTGGPSTC